MWKIVFGRKLFEELQQFLFNTVPRENGCFLLANHYSTETGKNVVLITDIIRADENSWNYSTEHSLGPSSSFINRSVVLADEQNSGLIFVHTHPGTFHPPRFSPVDEKSNRKIFANLAQILPDRPLGSLVVTQESMCGVVYHRGKIQAVSSFVITGQTITEFGPNGESSSGVRPTFDRQVRAIGEQNQKKLQGMTVTVVGAGGVGSAVAVQLARMGVKKLRLIDRDAIDETNVSRVYGSTRHDLRKAKVDVLKKHIASFSKTEVEALKVDITKVDHVSDLIDSDVIFGCTDNLTSRAILNDISIQYSIPLIDVGTRIHLEKDKSIDQAIIKVQVVTPDNACLWCTGTLDGKIILQESLSAEERKKLAEEGYYEDVQKQPSIISMTTMAASMAVIKLLSLVGVFGKEYDARTQFELKGGFVVSDTPEIKSNCICRKRRGIGEKRRIVN